MKQHLTKLAIGLAITGSITSRSLFKNDPPPPPTDWAKEASTQFSNGNFQEAVRLYQLAIDKKGPSFETHYALGRCYSHLKQYGKSVKSFEKAMELGQSNGSTDLKGLNESLMVAYFDAGLYKASIAKAEQILSKDSTSLLAYRYAAKSHYAAKDYDAALKSYKKYLPKLSLSANEKIEALQQAAFSAYGLRKSREARAYYEAYFTSKQNKALYITNDDWYWRGQVANVNLDNEAKNLYWSKLPENYLKSKGIDK